MKKRDLHIKVVSPDGVQDIVLGAMDTLSSIQRLVVTNEGSGKTEAMEYGKVEYAWDGSVLTTGFSPNLQLRKETFHKLLDEVL
jgi:hypothetical protein